MYHIFILLDEHIHTADKIVKLLYKYTPAFMYYIDIHIYCSTEAYVATKHSHKCIEILRNNMGFDPPPSYVHHLYINPHATVVWTSFNKFGQVYN